MRQVNATLTYRIINSYAHKGSFVYTYFARHSSELDIDTNTFEMLWNNDYVAIHYPHDIHGTFDLQDAKSLDPNDYEKTARSCLKKLIELSRNGGYVFAVYRNYPGGKIGYVEPNSKIELLTGAWGKKWGYEGREATLKAIKLNRAINLSASESISLKSVQPRQGTFCTWWKSGTRVKSLLDGCNEKNVGHLTPDLQEVMCMEFLRTPAAEKYGLPTLQSTLSPVGRTMKDIDIHGITSNNETISAQVTFLALSSSGWKIKKLDSYAFQGHFTILFCNCEKQEIINGHLIFPLSLVFHEFCEKNIYGSQWLSRVLCA